MQCLETESNVIPTLRKFRLLILSTGDTMVNKIKQNIGPQGACHLVWGGRKGQEPYTGQHPVKGRPGWLGAPGSGLQKVLISRTSLVVQCLRLCAPNTRGTGSILGQGTEIPRVRPKTKSPHFSHLILCPVQNVLGKGLAHLEYDP